MHEPEAEPKKQMATSRGFTQNDVSHVKQIAHVISISIV